MNIVSTLKTDLDSAQTTPRSSQNITTSFVLMVVVLGDLPNRSQVRTALPEGTKSAQEKVPKTFRFRRDPYYTGFLK